MTTQAIAEKLYTIEDYFGLEKNSDIRHEYHYGKLIDTPRKSKIANDIANNILEVWRKKLSRIGYRHNTHDVKAQVKRQGIFRNYTLNC
jgi:Uma2 family endonuclease